MSQIHILHTLLESIKDFSFSLHIYFYFWLLFWSNFQIIKICVLKSEHLEIFVRLSRFFKKSETCDFGWLIWILWLVYFWSCDQNLNVHPENQILEWPIDTLTFIAATCWKKVIFNLDPQEIGSSTILGTQDHYSLSITLDLLWVTVFYYFWEMFLDLIVT